MSRIIRFAGLVTASAIMLSVASCAPGSQAKETAASSEQTTALQSVTETKSAPKYDLYTHYADTSYQFPKEITFLMQTEHYLPVQHINISTRDWSATGWHLDGGSYNYFKTNVDPLERVNDYSFKTKFISKLTCSKQENFKATCSYEEAPPYKLNEGDEMILYMPNTPMTVVPEAVKNVLKTVPNEGNGGDPSYLQYFVLYNVTTDTAYEMDCRWPMFASEEITGFYDMSSFYGDFYTTDNSQLKIYKEQSTGEMRVDLKVKDEEEWKNMSVRKAVNDPRSLYAFGKSEKGTYAIIGIELYVEAEGKEVNMDYSLTVYEYYSEDQLLVEGSRITLIKNKDTGTAADS